MRGPGAEDAEGELRSDVGARVAPAKLAPPGRDEANCRIICAPEIGPSTVMSTNRQRADRERWAVIDVFSDAAIGGAAGTSERQRPGMNALLARVEAGGIDQVLADTSSRIARNQGDTHHIRDRRTIVERGSSPSAMGRSTPSKERSRDCWTSSSGRRSLTTSSGPRKAGRPKGARRPVSPTDIAPPTGLTSGGSSSEASGKSNPTRRHHVGMVGAIRSEWVGGIVGIRNERYQARVLSGLKERLLDPEAVSLCVRLYHEENARRNREDARDRHKLERKLTDINGRIERLVEAIAAGAGEFPEVHEKLIEARIERDRLVEELASTEAERIIALHPTVASDYRAAVEGLDRTLADEDSPEIREDAVPRIRGLVHSIAVAPAQRGRGVEIEIEGRLNAMIVGYRPTGLRTSGV